MMTIYPIEFRRLCMGIGKVLIELYAIKKDVREMRSRQLETSGTDRPALSRMTSLEEFERLNDLLGLCKRTKSIMASLLILPKTLSRLVQNHQDDLDPERNTITPHALFYNAVYL